MRSKFNDSDCLAFSFKLDGHFENIVADETFAQPEGQVIRQDR